MRIKRKRYSINCILSISFWHDNQEDIDILIPWEKLNFVDASVLILFPGNTYKLSINFIVGSITFF